MFYAEKTSKALRFGDVLQGFDFSATPVIKEPSLEKPAKKYSIAVDLPRYSVIMDPCCQIGYGMISLTPLVPVRASFFDNPYLAEDLTRINRQMNPEQSIPPEAWETMPDDKKEERKKEGLKYAFASLFVYDKNDLLAAYPLRRKDITQTNYYMINFRDSYKLRCEKINSPEDAPLESKVLELSIETRKELREKIVSYFASIPKEDKAEED
jgi:hypothetical protein